MFSAIEVVIIITITIQTKRAHNLWLMAAATVYRLLRWLANLKYIKISVTILYLFMKT